MAEVTLKLIARVPWWACPLITLAKAALYLRIPVSPHAVGGLIGRNIKVEVVK